MLTCLLAAAHLRSPVAAIHLRLSPAPRMAAEAVAVASTGTAASERRAVLAAEWVRNEGFYQPLTESTRQLMSPEFVFMGPVVGPLNTQDYLGTLGVFKIYEAFEDLQMSVSPFTQDPSDSSRFWSVLRVEGTHTGTLNVGSAKVPPTGKRMVVGPQAVSVTFDAQDKVCRFTGGYICDVRDGATGDAGAMFAVMRSVGVPTPAPTGRLVKLLNWVGAKQKDYPKGRSHADDLPVAWAAMGRKHGRRTADAWSEVF